MKYQKPAILIIGGGLSGLVNAIILSDAGFEVTLVERKQYPFHRVCGEYVSNEVIPFLNSINIFPDDLGASTINKLIVTAVNGKSLKANLNLGGFGISRFKFDHLLYEKAKKAGVAFIHEKVNEIIFKDEKFYATLSNGETREAEIAIGSFGKRSNLDQKLSRSFFYKRSPYLGVKYHVKTNFSNNTIQLDNFNGGYCGINKIEDDLYGLCYLAENKYLKKYGSIAEMERNVLFKNPSLKEIFTNADFVWDKPETINEISFQKKSLIENHLLMSGDAAGMITPLCGNGMAMAIHSAKILSETIIKYAACGFDVSQRRYLEVEYRAKWTRNFSFRLETGRYIQKLFGSNVLSNIAVSSLSVIPPLSGYLISKTHGKPF